MDTIRIDRRFRGPSKSGNGGVSAGLVAGFVDGEAAEITLRAPPPLDTDLSVETVDGQVRVTHEGSLVATGRSASLSMDAPPAVSWDDAEAARAQYRNRDHHPLPECFVCGIARDDGLCVHPGPVAERDVVATPWAPDASLADEDGLVRSEIVWGALDCPSFMGLGKDAPFALLGRITARVERRPAIGEPCVVTGYTRAPQEGRKLFGGSALWGESGDLLGVAHATWIVVDRASIPD